MSSSTFLLPTFELLQSSQNLLEKFFQQNSLNSRFRLNTHILFSRISRSVELRHLLFSLVFLNTCSFSLGLLEHSTLLTIHPTRPPGPLILWGKFTKNPVFIWRPSLPNSSSKSFLQSFSATAKVVLLKVLTPFWDFYYTSRVVGVLIWEIFHTQILHLNWTSLYNKVKILIRYVCRCCCYVLRNCANLHIAICEHKKNENEFNCCSLFNVL